MNTRIAAIVALLLVILALMSVACMRSRAGLLATEQRARSVPTVAVSLAAHDIPAGKQVTDQDIEVFQKQQEELAVLPADVLRSPMDFLGGWARVPIAKGGCFSRANLKPPPSTLAEKVEKGFVAMELPRYDPRSVTGLRLIDLDDRLDVLGLQADRARASGASSTVLAENVRVLAINLVFDKFKEAHRLKLIDFQIAEMKSEKERLRTQRWKRPSTAVLKVYDGYIAELEAQKEPVDKEPTITLEVTAEQARRIAEYRVAGKIALLVQNRERVDW